MKSALFSYQCEYLYSLPCKCDPSCTSGLSTIITTLTQWFHLQHLSNVHEIAKYWWCNTLECRLHKNHLLYYRKVLLLCFVQCDKQEDTSASVFILMIVCMAIYASVHTSLMVLGVMWTLNCKIESKSHCHQALSISSRPFSSKAVIAISSLDSPISEISHFAIITLWVQSIHY